MNVSSQKTFFKQEWVYSKTIKHGLTSIPRGQFIRLKRNCTEEKDFCEQEEFICKRFTDKEHKTFIKGKICRVQNLQRETLIQNRVKVN